MAIMQKSGQRNNDTYPKSKDEAQKLRVNIIKSMGLPKVQKSIGDALNTDPRVGVQMIAQMIANVVAGAIKAVRGKFNAKVHIKAVEMCIKLAIRQVNLISKGLGKGAIPPQMEAMLAKAVADALDRQLKGGEEKPQQPQGQPGQEAQGQPLQPQQQGLLGG